MMEVYGYAGSLSRKPPAEKRAAAPLAD